MNSQDSLPNKIINAIQAVAGKEPLGLHEPTFDGNERRYLNECIDTTFVSSVGKFVDKFEADLAEYTGAKYAVAVVNGTSALHISFLLAGVKNDDEVLVPTLTFVATTNAVTYCGAFPHFVDSDEKTLGIDTYKLKQHLLRNTKQKNGLCINKLTGRTIRAIVAVHVFGHPCDINGLLSIAEEFNIMILEDAAESLGSTYNGKHTGTFGFTGALSFNGNKIITCGGGGAILTSDDSVARRAKHITTTAKVPHAWEFIHDEVGYNYRLPNLNAALGCAQMEQLPSKLRAKRNLYARYKSEFSTLTGVSLLAETEKSKSNYWLNTIVLDRDQMHHRNAVLEATNNAGLMTRPVWKLMHELPAFSNCQRMNLETATQLSRRLINIPSSSNIL